MKRLLLWLIAVVIAGVPTITDGCRLACAKDRPAECPLHQPTPQPCSHDQSVSAADLTRPTVDLLRTAVVAIVSAPACLVNFPHAIDVVAIDRQHAPPLRSRHDILRI